MAATVLDAYKLGPLARIALGALLLLGSVAWAEGTWPPAKPGKKARYTVQVNSRFLAGLEASVTGTAKPEKPVSKVLFDMAMDLVGVWDNYGMDRNSFSQSGFEVESVRSKGLPADQAPKVGDYIVVADSAGRFSYREGEQRQYLQEALKNYAYAPEEQFGYVAGKGFSKPRLSGLKTDQWFFSSLLDDTIASYGEVSGQAEDLGILKGSGGAYRVFRYTLSCLEAEPRKKPTKFDGIVAQFKMVEMRYFDPKTQAWMARVTDTEVKVISMLQEGAVRATTTQIFRQNLSVKIIK